MECYGHTKDAKEHYEQAAKTESAEKLAPVKALIEEAENYKDEIYWKHWNSVYPYMFYTEDKVKYWGENMKADPEAFRKLMDSTAKALESYDTLDMYPEEKRN